MDEVVNPVRGSAGGALAWTYGGLAAKILCQYGLGIAIARLLGPEPYGLVACGMILSSLAGLIADGGISASLIQAPDLTKREIAGAWWLQVGLGVLLAAVIIAIAPWAAGLLGAPAAAPVIQALALLFPINALASTPIALLRRAMQARTIQIASIASYLVGYGALGLPLAIVGAGVWSLVAAQLGQALIQTAILHWSAAPDRRQPAWPRRLIGFSGWTIGNNIICWTHGNLLQIVAARWYGVAALGHYNRLGLFTDTAVSIIAGPLQQVLFPALAQSGYGRAQRERLVRAAVHGIALLFLPAMTVLALFPGVFVNGVFGERFAEESSLLPPMALSSLALAFSCLSGPILAGSGRPRDEWLAQVVALGPAAALIIGFAPYGMTAICWGLCLATWIRLLLGCAAILRAQVVGFAALVGGLVPALPSSIAGVAGAWLGANLVPDTHPILRLAAMGCLAMLSWGGCLVWGWRVLLPTQVSDKIQAMLAKRAQARVPIGNPP